MDRRRPEQGRQRRYWDEADGFYYDVCASRRRATR